MNGILPEVLETLVLYHCLCSGTALTWVLCAELSLL
jgi:hypothetical protein